jgi:RNA-binding protein YlmH
MIHKNEFTKLLHNVDGFTSARMYDLAVRVLTSGEPTFTDFLDPLTSKSIYESLSRNIHCLGRDFYMCFHDETHERRMLGFAIGQIEATDFPVDCLKITYTTVNRPLTHRDFLGGLVSTGVDRSRIGDIIVSESHALSFVHSRNTQDILLELNRIGKCSVFVEKIEIIDKELSNDIGEYKIITVTSMRVDGILSAVFRLSRSLMKEHSEKGKIFVNWREVNGGKIIKVDDVITLRGYGRVKIIEAEEDKRKETWRITDVKHIW